MRVWPCTRLVWRLPSRTVCSAPAPPSFPARPRPSWSSSSTSPAASASTERYHALFGIHDLGLFIVSGLLLNLMPGPDSLLIMSRSASQGARAGLAATAGIGTGVFVHIFAAALGLS